MTSSYLDQTQSLKPGWALIRKNIQMEEPTPMQAYLGCIHKRFEGKIDASGPVVVGVEYDMESFLAACVQRYLKLRETPSAKTTASMSSKKMTKK